MVAKAVAMLFIPVGTVFMIGNFVAIDCYGCCYGKINDHCISVCLLLLLLWILNMSQCFYLLLLWIWLLLLCHIM